MKRKIIVILFSVFLLACNSSKNLTKDADAFLDKGQYEDALFLLKKSFDLKANEFTGRKIATTYFNMRDFNQAEFWFKWIRSNAVFDVSDYYLLSEILIGNTKYDEAMLVLENLASFEVEQTASLKWQNLMRITHESPEIIKALTSKKIHLFTSLNSPFSDFGYFSFRNKKYFISNRISGDLKRKRKNKNPEASILNPFFKIYEFSNDPDLIQQVDSISITKSTILENVYHLGPIFINDSIFAYTYSSDRSSKSIQNMKLVNPQIKIFQNDKEITLFGSNAPNYFITDPFYSPSQNRIYFSANFEDSYGGLDLYYIEYINKDKWSAPINCGPAINSFGDERSPFMFEGLFYYSSNGKGGLGGFDIFQSSITFSENTPPTNMGIPYNSSKDDLFYFIDAFSNNLEVLTSDRDGGLGYDDIYYITQNVNSSQKTSNSLAIETDKTLAATSLKLDSNRVTDTKTSGETLKPNESTASNHNISKNRDASAFQSSDSNAAEWGKLDLDQAFAYFGIGEVLKSQVRNINFEGFLDRAITLLEKNSGYLMEFTIHSHEPNIPNINAFIQTTNQYLRTKGDFSNRINFRYVSNKFPLVNKDISSAFTQENLNNRLEFKLQKDFNTNRSYLYPHYYWVNSDFVAITNLDSRESGADEVPFDQFNLVSEFEPRDNATPTFSIVISSFASFNQAMLQKEMMIKKFPGFEYTIIPPTPISKRYRVSVFDSPSLEEVRENISSYYEKMKIKGIWILEHSNF